MTSIQPSPLSGSFSLIWYYWFKKYMQKRSKKSLSELALLKQKYKIEAIETVDQQNTTSIETHLEEIKERIFSFPAQNRLSITSCFETSSTSVVPPLFITINPEVESTEIQTIISEKDSELTEQEQAELTTELHSYYLNTKSIFIIYKCEKENSLNSIGPKLTNTSSFHESLGTSKVNLSSLVLEDDSLGDRNESFLESYDKMEDKIENLELMEKFAELDGLEIWNVKYFHIPHTYVKVKKSSWAKCINENNPSSASYQIIHPSQPKTVSSLPIIPRIRKYRPSIDKLKPFVSFMEILWSKFPNMSPLCESIFEYNGFPYIFTQDFQSESIEILCFYIVFGNDEGILTEKYVQRWIESNQNSTLAKTIKYMKEIEKNKNSHLQEASIKGLFDQSDSIW